MVIQRLQLPHIDAGSVNKLLCHIFGNNLVLDERNYLLQGLVYFDTLLIPVDLQVITLQVIIWQAEKELTVFVN